MANDEKSAQLVARLEHLPFSKWHKTFFAVAFFGIMFDAADFALFGAALPLISKEFGLNQAQAGLLATVGLVGAFCGALFWGTISDYIGRRTAFQATIGIFAAFTGLIAASWNVLSLAVFRFLANFGLGGEVPVTVTLSSEFSPGRIRGSMAGNILAAFPLGLALAAGLALLILPSYGWRGLFVVGVVPALLLFFVRRYMPESVRYHVNKGQIAEAEATVNHIEREALGRVRTPEEIKALPPVPADTTVTGRVPVMELLSDGRARRTSLLWIVSFGFFWASNGLLFMLPTILLARGVPLSQAITFMLIQALFGFLGYSACGFLVDRFGRRPVLFLYFFIGAIFHYWFAVSSGVWMYVAIACVGWVNPGVYGASSIYAGELYPTRMRATAVGWFFGIGRIGSFLSPMVIGFMLHYGAGAWVLHTFALAFLVAAIALWLVGIETKGRPLEEISAAR